MEVSVAAVQIGHIAEVVAALVEQLDTLDLAGAQRVSRTWAYEIRRSRVCQERLFMAPAARHKIITYSSKSQDGRKVYTLRDWTEADGIPEPSTSDAIVVVTHPLIKHTRSKLRPVVFEDFDFDRFLSLPTGRWQDMFITQPPAQRAALEVDYTFDDGPFLCRPETAHHHTYLLDEEGVRFCHILSELKQMVYPTSADFWTWLPDAYESNITAAAISLDDYIASYGFPRASGARIQVSGHVDAMDTAVVTAFRA